VKYYKLSSGVASVHTGDRECCDDCKALLDGHEEELNAHHLSAVALINSQRAAREGRTA